MSGIFAQYLPLPLLWSYIVLFGLALASIAALALSPGDRPRTPARWRPRAPYVPSGIRLGFLVATLAVSLAYCVGAIFLSLGAHMIDQFTHTENTAIVGALLALSSAFIGITGLLIVRVPAGASIAFGTALTIVSLALMAAATAAQSIGLFLGWCVIGGIAYSLTFTGGLGLINRIAPPLHRGATLSFLYLIAYALQAAVAIGVGALATALDLGIAVAVAAAILTGMCVLLAILAASHARAARAHKTTDAAGRRPGE